MKKIELTKGKCALVDDEDFEELNKYKWCFSNGYAGRNGKRIGLRSLNKKEPTIYMHSFILNTPKGMETDHIDCNKLNNQKTNLRICTSSQNKFNQRIRSNNTSGYKGVSWAKDREKWIVRIKYNNVYKFIGYFVDKEKAAKTYNIKAQEFIGEFARLNVT